MGVRLFHVPLLGSLTLLFGLAAVFLVGVLSLGIPSASHQEQLLASQLAMLLRSCRLSALGLHVRHHQHAPADPNHHLPGAGAVFRDHA